jgi:hypothetical protein
MDDEPRRRLGPHGRRLRDRSGRFRGAGAQQVARAKDERDAEKERAGEGAPTRERKGIQHVVDVDNKRVPRG